MNKTINILKKRKKISFTFILKLTKTIILTLLVFCILMNVLYVVGNYQNFQDKSQQLILNTVSYVSIITILLIIPVMVESIIRIFTIKKKSESIITLIWLILAIIVMICCIGFSSFIGYLSEGF